MKKGNVLMVCHGNICRSPLAHGIFEHTSKNYSITLDSTGTANYNTGNTPDPRSIKTAAAKGINIANQKARQFITSDFDAFDYTFVMDQEKLNNVLKLARTESDQNKVRLLLESDEVEDPY